MLRYPRTLLFASLLWGVSCSRPTEPPADAPATKRAGPVLDTPPPSQPRPPAASAGKAEPECAAAPQDAPPQKRKLGPLTAEQRGTTLDFGTSGAGDPLVLGVLGPFNEDSEANVAAVSRYLQFFASQKASAVVVAGDIGETEEGIAKILTALAKSGLPIFSLIGNRECKADYVGAVRAVAARYPHLIDLNQVRAVRFPQGVLVSIPGYHDANFINCAAGCRYFSSTVDEAIAIAKQQTAPVVLVAHGPPLGEGSQAVDYAVATGNVGDPEIRRALGQASIPFGLFTHIKESGARATDLVGTTRVAQGAFVKSLYLNPGPANTAKWKMNDGTVGYGFAATLTLKNGEAAWKSFRIPPPAAEEKRAGPKAPPAGKPVSP
ncbi:MAG: hypothetical protein ACKVPX_09880 [Myxococcaceae bacterium]